MSCTCCLGTAVLTPVSEANRPGLPALQYRVGTHGSFLSTLQARLSSADYPALSALRTREGDDFTLALMDAWACVADVLSFYQERIANEGYLRTATERGSVVELGRLLGFEARPGVSASVFFAYTLDASAAPVTIPAGSRAQSIPDPGQQAQSFETSLDFTARPEWNSLLPRTAEPQDIQLSSDGITTGLNVDTVYFKGASTQLKAGDLLLFVFGDYTGGRLARHVKSVSVDNQAQRTTVMLQEAAIATQTMAATKSSMSLVSDNEDDGGGDQKVTALGLLDQLLRKTKLAAPPTPQFANAQALPRSLSKAFLSTTDGAPQLLSYFNPQAAPLLYQVWMGALGGFFAPSLQAVYALRTKASVFGYNTLKTAVDSTEAKDLLYLDNAYEGVNTGGYVVIQDQDGGLTPAQILKAVPRPRTAYGISAKSVQLSLESGTWAVPSSLAVIQDTAVFAGSEKLDLDQTPVTDPIAGQHIELAKLYPGLQAGRWIVVSGERADLVDALGDPLTGVQGAELCMLSGVDQDFSTDLPGDQVHTRLTLAKPLAYTYTRATATLYANVVKATHGESRQEVMGSGDGTRAMQSFTLKQPPLTYVSAPTPSGIESTLQVRVDGVRWRGEETLVGQGPRDRAYTTLTGDDARTTVVFGSGEVGSRLPTGVENLQAAYRNGIGAAGNVRAGQISLLNSKPLGVKSVVNPLRASGGADPDTRDQARNGLPLSVMALDRLVSVKDYGDFAATFGGVGKASSTVLSDGLRQVVQVTIAGAGDIPIDATSDLYQNLLKAYAAFGDPRRPVSLGLRDLRLLVLSAKVRVDADRRWVDVEPTVRAALLDCFGFERRALAQSAYLSEAVAVIQGVKGVAFAQVDVFDQVPEGISADDLADLSARFAGTQQPLARVASLPARVDPAAPLGQRLLPAQLAYMSPAIPDTLILQELP